LEEKPPGRVGESEERINVFMKVRSMSRLTPKEIHAIVSEKVEKCVTDIGKKLFAEGFEAKKEPQRNGDWILKFSWNDGAERILFHWKHLPVEGQITFEEEEETKEEDEEPQHPICHRCGEESIRSPEAEFPQFCTDCMVAVQRKKAWPQMKKPKEGDEGVEKCEDCNTPYRLYPYEPKIGRDPQLCDICREKHRKRMSGGNQATITGKKKP